MPFLLYCRKATVRGSESTHCIDCFQMPSTPLLLLSTLLPLVRLGRRRRRRQAKHIVWKGKRDPAKTNTFWSDFPPPPPSLCPRPLSFFPLVLFIAMTEPPASFPFSLPREQRRRRSGKRSRMRRGGGRKRRRARVNSSPNGRFPLMAGREGEKHEPLDTGERGEI